MNKRLKALRDRRAQIIAEQQAILDMAEKEDRGPTEEEVARFDALKEELKNEKTGIEARIAREEGLMEDTRRIAATMVPADTEAASDTRPEATRPSTGRSAPATPPGRYDVRVGRPPIVRSLGGGRSLHPGLAGVPGIWAPGRGDSIAVRDRAEDDPGRGFRSAREFINAVLDAGRTDNRRMDSRLRPLLVEPQAAAGSDEQGEYADAYGGFVVPESFSPQMLMLDPEADPIAGRTTLVPMATPIIKMPARTDKDHTSSVSGGLTVTRRPETVTGSTSRMATERISFEAHSLFGFAVATEELLQDSPISFAALLAAGFQSEFAANALRERLEGTGAGEWLGVFNSPCLVTVDKETGQAADTLLYANVIKARARCWRYSNAVWLANHDTLPQLMQMSHVSGSVSVPVWQPSAREDAPDLLLGRPLYFTEFCPTLGDKGDLLLGNWAEYLEGEYAPMNQAESIHVRFFNHERVFKFWMRNAGAPWWRSPLTPKKGSSTRSPFVVIADR